MFKQESQHSRSQIYQTSKQLTKYSTGYQDYQFKQIGRFQIEGNEKQALCDRLKVSVLGVELAQIDVVLRRSRI